MPSGWNILPSRSGQPRRAGLLARDSMSIAIIMDVQKSRAAHAGGWLAGMLPGLALAAALATAAYCVRRHPALASVSSMMIAILIGIGVRNLFGVPALARPGLSFSLRSLLRFAIVLLGLQLSFADLADIGLGGASAVVLLVVSTFSITIALGRVLGVDKGLTGLIAAGTAICGASAIVAANQVTRARREDVPYAVACVTLFGTIAMFAFPIIGGLVGLGPRSYGMWTGASIHEVGQVAAAAFQGGAEAGATGTIVKLTRVVMLAPLILALSAMARRGRVVAAGAAAPAAPWFVFGFMAMIALNSSVDVPTGLAGTVGTATGFLMTMSLAAVGLEVDIRKLLTQGIRPALLGLAASLYIAIAGLAVVLALDKFG
jgi:uncharacterized integral membrane protein (TIGR00698 family)